MDMDNPQLLQRVKQLNKQIQQAQEAYYSGSPIMPDADYDQLEAELQALIKTSPWLAQDATVFHKVGHAKATSGRIPHRRPMKSIENKYTLAGLNDFIGTLPSGTAIYFEPKFDGVSLSLEYENGVLVQALTRGDGEAGESCLEQIKACNF